jgi:twitching motility protein PilT
VSFARAIDSALRQNPDVVLVGELRNPDEYLAAIRLARTGHLVFATLHAETSEEAVRGVVQSFPEGLQHLVRTELAATLRAVVVQLLVPSRNDPERPTAICEVLIRTPAVAAIISRGAFAQLPGEIKNSVQLGMCLMDDALADGALADRITAASAIRFARDPAAISVRLGRAR